MYELTLDVQTFAVGIEDKGIAIRVRDVGPLHLTIQISLQESHFPLPMTTAQGHKWPRVKARMLAHASLHVLIWVKSEAPRGGNSFSSALEGANWAVLLWGAMS
jgi:hypothetical protein